VNLGAVLRDEAVYDYSLPEIVEKYQVWVDDDKKYNAIENQFMLLDLGEFLRGKF
jgi:hypothetical protein